jgi:hypothetical protein
MGGVHLRLTSHNARRMVHHVTMAVPPCVIVRLANTTYDLAMHHGRPQVPKYALSTTDCPLHSPQDAENKMYWVLTSKFLQEDSDLR